jgi:hypothetical protein
MISSIRLFATALLLSVILGCSGKPVIPKLTESDVKELPKDLQSKFEVTDSDAPTPTPSPTAEPIKGKKGKKIKRPKVAKKSKEKAPIVLPNRRPKVDPFWIGEKQTLEVTYLGLAAGEFTTEVLPSKKIGDRSVYHLKGTVKSSAVLNLFYRLDDMIESFWDYEGLFSHRFHMVLDETKQARDVLELYDQDTKKAFYWNRRNQPDKPPVESKEYFDMAAFAQDSFTAAFYLRTLPLVDGQTYIYPVISEGKGWDCVVNVVRREMADTPFGRRQTILVNPQTRYNGVMKQEKGEGFIWLTDDDRRFIVRLEAKVKIGSVAAQLKKVELGEKPAETVKQ